MLIIDFIVVFEKYDHHTRQPFQSPLLGTNNSWEPIFKSWVYLGGRSNMTPADQHQFI